MIWQLVFLGVAMGMNNALASVALGTMNMKRSEQLRTALIFGLFEALMPVIGLFIRERNGPDCGELRPSGRSSPQSGLYR